MNKFKKLNNWIIKQPNSLKQHKELNKEHSLLAISYITGGSSDSTPGNYCCLFPLLCVFLWMYRLISELFLVERGTGRNEQGVVVEWISACVWCLVSACSPSWYVLYLFVRFFFGLLSTCVTLGSILWRWAKWEKQTQTGTWQNSERILILSLPAIPLKSLHF